MQTEVRSQASYKICIGTMQCGAEKIVLNADGRDAGILNAVSAYAWLDAVLQKRLHSLEKIRKKCMHLKVVERSRVLFL